MIIIIAWILKNLKNLKDNLKKLRNIYGNNEKNFLMSEKKLKKIC